MKARPPMDVSRRERQILEVIYQRGKATVADVQEQMPDPPSYSAVRAMLRILEEKGYLKHEVDGPRYLYKPVLSREKASRSALTHLVQTFFDGSVEAAVTALLDTSASRLSDAELDRLAQLVAKAKKEGR